VAIAEQPDSRCCDECGSDYLAAASQMSSLCPECAHRLYGYTRCDHTFVGGRCSRCGWDGSVSEYLRRPQSQPAEISYDLVMGDDMGFVEGTFRLPGGDWQVVIVSRYDVPEPVAVPQVWDSGVRGVYVRFPRGWPLNAVAVERALSDAVGIAEWVVVRGPDSMQLR
jgi:hypothetical protein